MRQHKLSSSNSKRRPTLLQLLCAAAFFSILVFAIQSSFFTGTRKVDLNRETVANLYDFQTSVQQCVANRGLGLTADIIDHCKLVLKFPEGTNSTWYNEQFKVYEPLEYKYDVCETILLWEQYRNMTTVLTREYLDARPDGWLDYAAKRIAQLGADKCYNRTLCEEHLNLILPAKPPFHPRQFRKCAVVGNSGDLLKTEFGEEIDSHDAVIRENEAPVNDKYAKYVGLKRDFRLVVRGAARNMVTNSKWIWYDSVLGFACEIRRKLERERGREEGGKAHGCSSVAEEYGMVGVLEMRRHPADEILIIKSVTHRDVNAMIKTIPNPVYLFQGIVLRRGAKGTGMKSIELALSMCDIVDIYGFTVDPGYTEWTQYFSTPRKGHNPLQGRAYYQLLECLGVVRIHSPMRSKRKQDWSDVPSREMIGRAHAAALSLKRSQTDQAANLVQFGSCKVWGNVDKDKTGPVSGSSHMSTIRKYSNYSKWEVMPFQSLRKEAQDHFIQMEGVSLYKMDGNKLDDLVCVRHSFKSKV
ncbi:Sialyltransferase-like protein [Quillaja saponaria]|uniref:Sialyltransferase-like protein n=1 Tax=Quillaja saponaria TaxID=32244 RepID=A0AAD7PZ00_QUISA|nr:Sialyltransferase-like protein [Quillaja saponaria]